MGVNKLYNVYQAGKQIAKTVGSPITHAKNIISSAFPNLKKKKKLKIGGTKKSDQIKKSNKVLKDLEKTMQKDMSPELKAKGEKLKQEVKKTQKEIYKAGFKKGGRAGFNKGSKDPVGKKKNGKTPFGMLSVKAGIDKNPNPTYADKIAGGKMKNKKKVI